MNKQKWLDLAEIKDAFRIVPTIYMVGYAWFVWDVWDWYKELPDPTTQQSSFFGALIGAASVLTGWYLSTGRKWDKK